MNDAKTIIAHTKHLHRSRVALAVAVLMLAVFAIACRKEIPVAPEQYVSQATYSVETLDEHTVTDESRNREFPVRVRFPSGAAEPLPVVIFSHGAGAVDRGHLLYQEWGTRLAMGGYAVIQLAHVEGGTANHCTPLEIPPSECRPLKLLVGETLGEIWYSRPRDVTAVIDHLDEIAAAAGVELDADRIALMGHSGGAHTVMSSAGAGINFSDSVRGVTYFEPRVKAFVAHSPQGPGSLGFSETSWDNINVPMLITTGAADTGPTVSDPVMRTVPFQSMTGPDLYQLHVDSPDAEHNVFGLSARVGQGGRPLTQLETYVLSTSLAFLDGYLLNLSDAREWLASGDIEAWSENEATIASK